MIDFFKNHKKISIAFLMIFVFLFGFAARYFVYWSKGYVVTGYNNLLVARNYAETGRISYENKENVVLSTEAVKTEGVPTDLGNKLAFFLYAFLFRLFGFHPELPLYTTFILYSLGAVFIFLIALRIFGFKIGIITAVLSAVAPFVLPSSTVVAAQEWGWFFLALAFFFYFWPNQKKIIYLVLTGLFLGLSVAAKNSYFMAFFPFLLLEFWQNRHIIKTAVLRSAIFSLVFIFVAGPFVFLGGNYYLSILLYFPSTPVDENFSNFGHLFPDPYTFHYAKDEFLRNFTVDKNIFSNEGFHLWGDSGSFLQEYGLKMSFFRGEIITRVYSAWMYFKGLFLTIIIFGGLLTWFFIFICINELLKKKKGQMVLFSSILFVSWFFWLVALRTSNYSTQLLILAPLVLMFVAVGICKLAELVSQSVYFPKISANKILIGVILIFLVSFAELAWWNLHEVYWDAASGRKALEFAKTPQIKNQFDKEGVTAVGFSKDGPEMLNYYLDRSFVYFASQTIQKLADKGELDKVFKNYNITGFIGYDEELSKTINKNTNNKLKNYSIGF